MKKIDWVRKLTSRKLWLSIVAFATLMISYITGDKEQATQIAEIIMAAGVVIGYVIGEGLADGARIELVEEKEFYQDEN